MTHITNEIAVATEQYKITWIPLAGDYRAIEEFFSLITKLVLDAVANADIDAMHTTRSLCGEAFWSVLTMEEKRLAGRCMAKLVKTRAVPFVLIPRKGKGTKKYRKI